MDPGVDPWWILGGSRSIWVDPHFSNVIKCYKEWDSQGGSGETTYPYYNIKKVLVCGSLCLDPILLELYLSQASL